MSNIEIDVNALSEVVNDKADRDLGNLTEEGDIKLGKGGIELCDIGMALYIDETKGLRRYLNGQIVDINTNTQAFLNRLQEITTLHPSLLCTEEEWQTAKTMSAFGQVGKFVFNYSGEDIVSVRLPRVVNVQGLFDLQNLGMTIEAGLPNIEGKLGSGTNTSVFWTGSAAGATGCFYQTGNDLPFANVTATGSTKAQACFDASRSNSIYGKSNTVQQEAIQYPYFIQIATGSETENNIVNDIELNNPYSLFDSKYSDHELNNLSWLKSSGQQNSKAVYPTAYDKLLKVYNGTETVEGLSVKLSTETYTDYDFVLNTADETFRLPLDTIDHPINSTGTLPVKGNGMSLGLFDARGNYFGIEEVQTVLTSARDAYGVPVGSTSTGADHAKDNTALGITTDPTKSGIVADLTSKKANLYLYYYVGETVQNANLIDAGRIGEQVASCITRSDCKAYVTETYKNGTSWYRIYSDGWCEQGGYFTAVSNDLPTNVVSFLKKFTNTKYFVAFTHDRTGTTSNTTGQNFNTMSVRDKKTNSFTFWCSTAQALNGACWEARGYLAQGEY